MHFFSIAVGAGRILEVGQVAVAILRIPGAHPLFDDNLHRLALRAVHELSRQHIGTGNAESDRTAASRLPSNCAILYNFT